jgi:hypothetical protein
MIPHILLPFSDDSTLFFAQAMQALLAPLPCKVSLALLTDGATLSPRQLATLPQGPDRRMQQADLASPQALAGVDAIVTSKMFKPLQGMLGDDGTDTPLRPAPPLSARPVVVAFLPGLNLTPTRGFTHRRAADAVFLVPRSDIAAYQDYRRQFGGQIGGQIETRPQWVDFGHPSFLLPQDGQAGGPAMGDRRDIYFFAQAISPLTRTSRIHLLNVLAALARRHPDRTVWIKLRHLPDENADHVHREEHDYPGLLAALPDAPSNLALTACTMAEAVTLAAIGITCTSTAAADLIQAGVPTQIYLDYVENYLDPLTGPMRRLFGGSNLIATLPEVLNGVVRSPDPDWLAGLFCVHDLGERVLAAILKNSV